MPPAFAGPFEMDRLLSYDDAALIAEMKRVAALVPGPTLTRAEFERFSRACPDVYRSHFGSWRSALSAAGLEHRYGGPPVTDKMRSQASRSAPTEDIIAELQRIAHSLDCRTLRRSDLKHSAFVGDRVVVSRFGSWKAALQAAGLELAPHGRRWTDDDCFENLLEVWTHHGRVPTYAEMDLPPSRITAGGYAARFGSWGRAKQAFVARVNADIEEFGEPHGPQTPSGPQPTQPRSRPEDRRTVSVGLRYMILSRDRFRCVTCGRSPATDLGCALHIDHVIPISRGGKTLADNLRTLCESCNLGRGNRYME